MNKAMQWIDAVRGTDSIREVARKSDVTQATLNRQVNLDMLTFEVVRDVARAYGRPLLSDLVRLEFLSTDDVGSSSIENALRSATDEQLLLAVAERLDVSSTLFDKPISVAVEEASNVTHLHDVRAPKKNRKEVANESIEEFPDGDDADHDGGA